MKNETNDQHLLETLDKIPTEDKLELLDLNGDDLGVDIVVSAYSLFSLSADEIDTIVNRMLGEDILSELVADHGPDLYDVLYSTVELTLDALRSR